MSNISDILINVDKSEPIQTSIVGYNFESDEVIKVIFKTLYKRTDGPAMHPVYEEHTVSLKDLLLQYEEEDPLIKYVRDAFSAGKRSYSDFNRIKHAIEQLLLKEE